MVQPYASNTRAVLPFGATPQAPPAPRAYEPPPAMSSPPAMSPPPMVSPPPSMVRPAAPPSVPSREEPRDGALSFSNAAAGASAAWSAPRAPVSRTLAPVDVEPEPAATRDVVRLVWFDADAVPRIRRVPRWKPVLSALERQALDRDLDDPAAEADPMAVEDRREIFEILAGAEAIDARGVRAARDGAVRKDGKYVAPLVLVSGEIETPFEEVARLEAVIAAAAPHATSADVELSSALETARKLLGGGALSSAWEVADALAARIREAFVKEKKSFPPEYLDGQAARALVRDRRFQKRDVLGETHLRLLIHAAGADAKEGPIVVYAPERVAKKLPMYQRFAARLIAEVHLQEDEGEAQPSALRVLALARCASVPRAS